MKASKQKQDQNPFTLGFSFSTKWLLNTQRGYESIEIDLEDHVKVYPALSRLLPYLSSAEMKLLAYIFTHYPESSYEKGLDPIQKDYIQLTPKSTQIPESTFHRAKTGLINANIISHRAARQSTYWINPKMMFKGNRIKTYPDNTLSVNKDPLSELKSRKEVVSSLE